MRDRCIDLLFITNIPSFYKINQWNLLSKKCHVFVVFTGCSKEERTNDFFSNDMYFGSLSLTGSIISKSYQLFKLLISIKYNKLIVSGWDTPMVLFPVFLFSKRKNSCVVESSVYELHSHILKNIAKKLFLRRISTVYASGIAQGKLVKVLGFKEEIKYTGGCGILNYVEQPKYEPRDTVNTFLYVGRLSSEKNLKHLIKTFSKLPQLNLQIIGYGSQEHELKEIATKNVLFLGVVKNKELWHYYRDADVFILPSLSEPWGLVVEEALNNGTPVMVSNKVGCKDDLVICSTGLVFDLEDEQSLYNSITKITDIEFYNSLRKGVSLMDFEERAKKQIDIYFE